MNLQQMRSLAAILEARSFSAAAAKIGLSHSAISLQIKSLEEELGNPLFDRTTRPPRFTNVGKKTAEAARKALLQIEDVRRIGAGESATDHLSIGVVPTTLLDILPVILRRLHRSHPDLQLNIKSGLSSELTTQVLNGEIDVAIITCPIVKIPEIEIRHLVEEPLYVIASKNVQAHNDEQMLRARPFIGFSQKTWLGQQISARLQSRGIYLSEHMEIDSLDAVERMVTEDFGVSIVPQKFLAKKLSKELNLLPFCNPQEYRKLSAIYLKNIEKAEPLKIVFNIIDRLHREYQRPQIARTP